MKLEYLRRKGSQALDEYTEFILTERALLIFETLGNGIYHLARSYKVIRSRFETSYIDLNANDAEALMRK